MTNKNNDLRMETAAAVRIAADELHQQSGGSKLFGFALCTDDDVRTLFHVACTPDWVKNQETSYPEIGFVYTEWTHSATDAPFTPISQQLAALATQTCSSDNAWSDARDSRFEALVRALKDCRDAGVFSTDTLLCVGSTDPSDHLEALAMNSVDRLNSPDIANRFAEALGYEKYRSKAT
ncbi:MAG: DUF4303 domain-containing protein [Candidatus Obscuribacterales bacterium]|nr:DUF4303 domain-containing protein [Candidatus Obscuribacterales bacterium]